MIKESKVKESLTLQKKEEGSRGQRRSRGWRGGGGFIKVGIHHKAVWVWLPFKPKTMLTESGHTNLRNPPDHLPADSQALDEGPGRDKGPDHLCLHVPGGVTEGPQRLLLFGHALEVFLRQAGLQGTATRSTGGWLLHNALKTSRLHRQRKSIRPLAMWLQITFF